MAMAACSTVVTENQVSDYHVAVSGNKLALPGYSMDVSGYNPAISDSYVSLITDKITYHLTVKVPKCQ